MLYKMKAADYAFSSRKGIVMLTYSRGPHDVTDLGPSRPLHKWPPVKSAPDDNVITSKHMKTEACKLYSRVF